MRKQLLLFGASLATAAGAALLALTLVVMFASAATAAYTEANNDGSKCKVKQSNGDCGTNDCPTDKPNCHILVSNNCGCQK